MKKTHTLAAAAVAVALIGWIAPAQAQIAPPGPEADPYLQHYHGTPSAKYGHLAGAWLPGKDLSQVSVAPPGPEADLYLQHYNGTVSAKYGGGALAVAPGRP